MRVSLETLLDKLGVDIHMDAYSSYPWAVADETRTINAEARMNEDARELEIQIDLMRDEPVDDEKPAEVVFYQRFTSDSQGQWTAQDIRLKGEDKKSLYAWEEKGCEFFKLVISALKRNEMPDLEDLIEEAFHRNERFSDQHGGGTSKSPKIKPGQLFDMKQGRGF